VVVAGREFYQEEKKLLAAEREKCAAQQERGELASTKDEVFREKKFEEIFRALCPAIRKITEPQV